MHNKIILLSHFHYSFCSPCSFLSLFVWLFNFFCEFLFHLLFPLSLSLTVIIGIFYCLNYTFLLFHLIRTYLVAHLSLSSITHLSHLTKSRIFKNINLRKTANRTFRSSFLKNHFRHLKLYSNPPS